MDRDYDILAAKVAEYIGAVQPQLDKVGGLEAKVADYEKRASAEKSAQDAFKANFAKRATEALGALAKSGLISQNDVTPMVEKSAEDPSYVWGLVEKIAASVGPEAIGSRSRETAAAEPVDPFVREFGNYAESAGNGMID